MILLRNGLKPNDHWVDQHGQIVYINVQVNDNEYNCVNIYAPNEENNRCEFFKIFISIIDE